MKNINLHVERVIFRSRWLLAPFFLGLIIAIIILLGKFVKELYWISTNFFNVSGNESIVSILTLVDTSLIACLLLIIIFSGYEIFVSKINFGEHEDHLEWMGKVDFSDLKLKLISSIVAISSVELLRAIINIEQNTNEVMAWKIGVHLTFVFTGVLFALTDFIIARKGKGH